MDSDDKAMSTPKRPPLAAHLTDHPDRILAVLSNARYLVGAMGGSPKMAKGVIGCLAAAESLTRHWEQFLQRHCGVTSDPSAAESPPEPSPPPPTSATP